MNIISKAKRYIEKTGSISGAAAKLRMPRSSLRRLLESPSTKKVKTAPRIAPNPEPIKGQWMQSLHHSDAHFIANGQAACHGASNGAKITPGSMWFPHDGCLRKCQRCMKHAAA